MAVKVVHQTLAVVSFLIQIQDSPNSDALRMTAQLLLVLLLQDSARAIVLFSLE